MCEETLEEEIREEKESDKGVTACGEDGCIHALIIAGQIEGHYAASNQTKSTKYEHVIPTLVAVEESKEIDGLLILLNTIGGDVEAGRAIAEVIAGMKKPTVSLVLGGSHSIGVPLAVAAKTSFIVPSATMTLHPVRMNGLVIAVPQQFNYFRRMQDRILAFVVNHSGAKREKLLSLMMKTDEIATDVGSVIDGREAVDIGLIDAVGGLSDAMHSLKGIIAERNPERFEKSIKKAKKRLDKRENV